MLEFMLEHLDIAMWIVALILFGVAEAATVAIVSIWFILGALVAIGLALLGVPVLLQILVFLGVSFGTLALCRKSIISSMGQKKIAHDEAQAALVGKTGVLSLPISPASEGQAVINGVPWTARDVDPDMSIEKDTRVVVCRQEGVYIYVERYEL